MMEALEGNKERKITVSGPPTKFHKWPPAILLRQDNC